MNKAFVSFLVVTLFIMANSYGQTQTLFQYFNDKDTIPQDELYAGCSDDYWGNGTLDPHIYFSIVKKRDTIVNATPYSLFSFSDEKDSFELWIGAKDNCMYLIELNDFSHPVEICNDSNKTPLLKTLSRYYTVSLVFYEYNAGTVPDDGYEEVTIQLDLRLKESDKNIFRSKKLRWLMISSQHGAFISLESGDKYYTG
jgi:hypothetical protein